jgi:hypothetical protein
MATPSFCLPSLRVRAWVLSPVGCRFQTAPVHTTIHAYLVSSDLSMLVVVDSESPTECVEPGSLEKAGHSQTCLRGANTIKWNHRSAARQCTSASAKSHNFPGQGIHHRYDLCRAIRKAHWLDDTRVIFETQFKRIKREKGVFE